MRTILSVLIGISVLISPDIEHKVTPIRLGEDVLVFEENWGEGHMTVVATDEGLVVIDTFMSPRLARDARNIIEQEWPKLPIRYVIYTDWHADHSSGNQVFAESTIIGHTHSIDRLPRDRTEDIEAYFAMAAEIEERMKTERLTEEEYEYRKTLARNLNQLAKDLREYVFTPPDITLDHGGILKLGNRSFILFDFGPAHTDSDIVVYVPEIKLLIASDLVFNRMIPGIDISSGGDILNHIAALDKLIQMGEEISTVIPGHGSIGDIQIVEAQKKFLQDLCSLVNAAMARGISLEQATKEIRLEKYSDYKNYRPDRVAHTVECCWKMLERASAEDK